jgi:hypothetical protein
MCLQCRVRAVARPVDCLTCGGAESIGGRLCDAVGIGMSSQSAARARGGGTGQERLGLSPRARAPSWRSCRSWPFKPTGSRAVRSACARTGLVDARRPGSRFGVKPTGRFGCPVKVQRHSRRGAESPSAPVHIQSMCVPVTRGIPDGWLCRRQTDIGRKDRQIAGGTAPPEAVTQAARQGVVALR